MQPLKTHFHLGLVALHQDNLTEAEQCFQRVLALDARDCEALVNLGVIALKREDGQTAIRYFTDALLLDEQHHEARHNLAATFMHYDRFENALIHYRVLLKEHPQEAEYLYNAGVAEMALGQLAQACADFETLLQQQSAHADALVNLAAIHNRLGKRQQAIELLTQALNTKPGDSACQFMLAALTGDTQSANTCPDYARNLFNNYALYYNQHLKHTLHYSLPEQLARLLHRTIFQEAPFAESLDLGCGTGLMGNLLRELSTHLTGVDIAEKMLKQAARTGLYDELINDEAVRFLLSCQRRFNLIMAADMLPYLGDLDALFSQVTHCLCAKGYWVFSTELGEDTAYHLQSSARFTHHPDYINALKNKHQLQLVHQEHLFARRQAEQDVAVMVYIMQAS